MHDYPTEANCGQLQTKGYIDDRSERTVEQNIDAKIYALKQEIARLEASKENLKPLLNIKIRDLREAASY